MLKVYSISRESFILSKSNTNIVPNIEFNNTNKLSCIIYYLIFMDLPTAYLLLEL